MNTDKTPTHIKLDERNYVEKFMLDQLEGLGRGIIYLMQDLLTGKKRVTAFVNDTEVAGV